VVGVRCTGGRRAHRGDLTKGEEMSMYCRTGITEMRMPAGGGRAVLRLLLVGALLAVSIFIGLGAFGSSSAEAATGRCAGTLVESRNLVVNKKKVGELAVYYNRATGKNCARMNHAGSTWGKKLMTRVWVGICSETEPNDEVCHYDPATDGVDKGEYRYYAGPASTKVSAAGRCIAASGYLWIDGKRYSTRTRPWVGHCG
jgi:hypothetical protein